MIAQNMWFPVHSSKRNGSSDSRYFCLFFPHFIERSMKLPRIPQWCAFGAAFAAHQSVCSHPVTHFLLPSCSLVSLVFLSDFARISADCAASRVGQPSDIPCPHLAPGLGHLAPLRYTQTSSNCVGTAQKPLVFKGLYHAKVHDISTWISTFFLFPKVKRG